MREILTRIHLLDLVLERGYRKAAEVGVFEGAYSNSILLRTGVDSLFCVDPFDGRGMKDVHRGKIDADDIFPICDARLRKFGNRVEYAKITSEQAADTFLDGDLDFVYIDAKHTKRAIKRDLELWYPKVREGGMIAGHDYKNRGSKLVKQVVDSFFEGEQKEVHETSERTSRRRQKVKSFFVIK